MVTSAQLPHARGAIRAALRTLLFGALMLPAIPVAAQATQLVRYKVIVNVSNPVSTISRAELAAMFLKKADSWATGALVVPVDQPERALVRQSFSRDVIGKPPAAVKSYWNQLVFSGRNVPPAEKMSDTEVINFVKGTPSAVGYVSATAKTKGVKVLTVDI
jgi:ABC-type phosphate transport system substrate-binding protein